MEISIFLAKVIGLVCVISAAAVISRYRKNMAIEKDAVANLALAMLAGYAILILGVLIVVSHNVWVWDWRVVITIFGWLILLKGVGRLFFPDAVKNMIEKKQHDLRFMIGEFAVLAIGLYLLYYGFIVN
jgi:hypothetical protein